MKGLKGFTKRLINILHAISFILIILVSVFVISINKPIQQVDNKKSTITCHNGQTYSFQSVGIHYFSEPVEITNLFDKRKVWDACLGMDREGAYLEGWKDKDIDRYEIDKIKDEEITAPSLNVVTYTKSTWISAFTWGIFAFIIGYMFISIVRETLLYLFLAEKFTFKWLKDPITYIQNLNNKND